MINIKNLIYIRNSKESKKYYDEWSNNYESTLFKWKYQAPKKAVEIFKNKIDQNPKNILDLACGTGLFGVSLKRSYPKSLIDGADISSKSLKIAKNKEVYNNLFIFDFQKKFYFSNKKYNLISCIGSMTYCKYPEELFNKVYVLTLKGGFFLFTHRSDMWEEQNLNSILKKINNKWRIIYISRKSNYLPKNKDFSDKVRIKYCILQKD